MAVVRNLMVRAGADFSQMQKAMQNAQNDVQTFGSKVSKAMNMVTVALSTIAGLTVFTDMVKDAIKVEGSIQSLGKLMGENANDFMMWANTSAAAFGMSKKDAIVFGKTYANLTSQFSANTHETMSNTQELLKASAVVASGTGRTMEDVLDRIRSGMLGNTEAIEDLGVFVNVAMIESTDAFKRFANGKSWAQLGFQTQQQIRYFAILEQISKKFGTEIADTTGSRLMTFQANLANLKLALGTAFLPILNVVLPILTKFVQKLAYAAEFVAKTMSYLFDKKDSPAKKAKEQAVAVNNVSEAFNTNTEAVKRAAKAQKGFLAGFDEINQVQIPEPGSVAEGASTPEISMPNTDMGEVGSGMLDGLYDQTIQLPEWFKNALDKVRGFFLKYKEEIGNIFLTFLAGTILKIPFLFSGVALFFKNLYEENETFRNAVDETWNALKTAGQFVYDNVLVPIGNILKDTILKAWDNLKISIQWLWDNVLVPFGDWLKEFKDKVLKPVASTLSDVLGYAFQSVADIAKSLWENALKPVSKNIQDKLQPVVEDVSSVFESLWTNVIKPLGTYIGDKLLTNFEKLANKLDEIWKEKLKPFLSWVREKLQPVFDTVFKAVGDKINSVIDIAAGVVKFFSGVFKGDLKKALQGLKDVFKGIFDNMFGWLKAPINLLIDGINKMIEGLNKMSFKVPKWVPGIGGKGFTMSIPKIPKLAKGGIVDSPTVAMVGEAGSEMVVPLENTSFVDKVASALGTAVMSAMQFNQSQTSNNNKEVVIQIDGHTIAKALNPYTKKESTRVGNSLLTVL